MTLVSVPSSDAPQGSTSGTAHVKRQREGVRASRVSLIQPCIIRDGAGAKKYDNCHSFDRICVERYREQWAPLDWGSGDVPSYVFMYVL